MKENRADIDSRTLPSGATLLTSPRGTAHLQRLTQGFLLFECAGLLPSAFYEHMVLPANRELEQSDRLVVFVDGWSLHSVETGLREQWTEWFKLHKHRMHMRLLVRTKLMEMAASLANLFTVTSVIETYAQVPQWDAACRGDLPGFSHVVKQAG